MSGRKVEAVLCLVRGAPLRVEAPVYIDSTANGDVCIAAGCEYRLGEDAASDFQEPGAPRKPSGRLNGLTLLYRITNTGTQQDPFLPEGVAKGACPKPAALRTCPNGDILVNAVSMIPGEAGVLSQLHRKIEEAIPLVYEHFYWMQTETGYGTWAIAGVAPEIGIRETRRIVGEYTLTEHDCLAGLGGQKHQDIIAITDHAVDIHGIKNHLYELPNGAYGVPYRCLLPKHTENLMVACRGASFSHIAASSCRLSRTMMTLGQAAGTAAAIAVKERIPLREIDVSGLRKELAKQGVELG
jgi:hypothetical protein